MITDVARLLLLFGAVVGIACGGPGTSGRQPSGAADAAASSPGETRSAGTPATDETSRRPHPAYRSDELSFETRDGVSIRANLVTPDQPEGSLPAVILIHQGGSNRNEWAGFAPQLAGAGYVVMAYDIRGHGESGPVANSQAIFSDPSLAPRDLEAALDHLRALPRVDPNRIAVVGASIGGNLACVAVDGFRVQTAVAMSAKTSAVYDLAGKQELRLRSIFYIASTGDEDGKRADWAQELYDRTYDPRRIRIVPGRARGVAMLRETPGLGDEIIRWLQETL